MSRLNDFFSDLFFLSRLIMAALRPQSAPQSSLSNRKYHKHKGALPLPAFEKKPIFPYKTPKSALDKDLD